MYILALIIMFLSAKSSKPWLLIIIIIYDDKVEFMISGPELIILKSPCVRTCDKEHYYYYLKIIIEKGNYFNKNYLLILKTSEKWVELYYQWHFKTSP